MIPPENPVNDGEIITTLSTTHFILIEVLYAPGMKVKLRGRGTPLLAFAVSGEFVAASAERLYGDDSTVWIIGVNEERVLECRQETRCVVVTPRPQAPSVEIGSLLGSNRHLRRSALKPLLRNVWCEARRADSSARLALDGAIFTLLAELHRMFSETQSPGRLGRSLRLLHSAGDETLSIAELARVSGMSVYAFARAFKEETGTTFAAYQRRLRVERAKELLRKTPKSVREICTEVGFTDRGHFARVFARYAGMSPADYRRVHS
ncbi:MAG TPA: AraC family transcriptional regulator [Thermoanaerobaculia bacterium]|nr:AraC family transcriptional regulator [Thermoanaerobaculia bacterium]